MPHRTWGTKQLASEAAAEKIRAALAAKIEKDIDVFGTTSTYYGRTGREALSSRFFQRLTK